MDANDVDPRLTAAVDLLHRAGATVFQIRYSDDEPPVVWIAVAGWVGPDGIVWQTGSSVDPVEAVMCLCETVVDGATCVHCGKTTSFIADYAADPLAPGLVCDIQYDPELRVFRRSCEEAPNV